MVPGEAFSPQGFKTLPETLILEGLVIQRA
jgi:hypothetical protein